MGRYSGEEGEELYTKKMDIDIVAGKCYTGGKEMLLRSVFDCSSQTVHGTDYEAQRAERILPDIREKLRS